MDALLTSRSDDAPSGENLEYEPVFAELERSAQPSEEKQAGEEIIEAQPPDYATVIKNATAVLEQSHDLRAGVHMAIAEIHLNGFQGLAGVTTYLRGCLDAFWDTCHPQLDEDDDDDPTMRVNAILGLTDDGTMLRGIKRAPLTLSQAFGRVSLRDIDIAKGAANPDPDAQNVMDEAAIAAAFQDTDDEVLGDIYAGAGTALEDIKAIDAIFNDKIPGLGPDLAPVMAILQRAVAVLAEATGADVEDDSSQGAEDAEDAAPSGGSGAKGIGAITSPRDVEMALERIMGYYAAHEPSSPVPTILARAKRLVGADFLTIMKDMAPDGMSQVMTVGGLEDEEY